MSSAVTRPEGTKGKINSKNEFELCYIRHRYLRRTTRNPSAEEMAPYENIVKKMSAKTYFTYKPLFDIIGFEQQDVVAIGNIHIVNFLGLFAIEVMPGKLDAFRASFITSNMNEPTEEDILAKNKANFTMFIKQRMEDVVRICRQKARNIKGTQVDHYSTFVGPKKPPRELLKLQDDHESFSFRKIDLMGFRTAKKRAKAKEMVFFYEGMWYVAVPLEHKTLNIADFAGADMDPYDNVHNMTPDRILSMKSEQDHWDSKREMFKNSSKEERAKLVKRFISKHKSDKKYSEEIKTARKLLKRLGK